MLIGKTSPPPLHLPCPLSSPGIQRRFPRFDIKHPFLFVRGEIVFQIVVETPTDVKISADYGILIFRRGVYMAKVSMNAIQKVLPLYQHGVAWLTRIPGEVMRMDYLGSEDNLSVHDFNKGLTYTPYGLPLPKRKKFKSNLLHLYGPCLFSNRANRSHYELYWPVSDSNRMAEWYWLRHCWIVAHDPISGWLLLVGKRRTPRVLLYNGQSIIRLPTLPNPPQTQAIACFFPDPSRAADCKILLILNQRDRLEVYRKQSADSQPWKLDIIHLPQEYHEAQFEAYIRVEGSFIWADSSIGRIWWISGWERRDIDFANHFGSRRVGNLLVRASAISGFACGNTPYMLLLDGNNVAKIYRIDVSSVVCTRLVSDLGGLNLYVVAHWSGFTRVPLQLSVPEQNMIYLAGWENFDCGRISYQVDAEFQGIQVVKPCHDLHIGSSSPEEESGEEDAGAEGGAGVGVLAVEEWEVVGGGGGGGEGGGEGEEGEVEVEVEGEGEGEGEEEYCNCQCVWFQKPEFVSQICAFGTCTFGLN